MIYSGPAFYEGSPHHLSFAVLPSPIFYSLVLILNSWVTGGKLHCQLTIKLVCLQIQNSNPSVL